MNPAMYIFLNRQLEMSTGKAAAQAGHAAVEAYRLSTHQLIDIWYRGGHYKKLVMEAQSATQLLVIQRYIEDRGFATKLIIDEGRTEIEPFQATALGVEIVDKDDPHVAATFGSFRLYQDRSTWQSKLPVTDAPPDVNPYPKFDPKHYAWRRQKRRG